MNSIMTDTGPKFLMTFRTFELKNLDDSNLTTFIVVKKVPSAIDRATKGMLRFIGSALTKFRLNEESASYIKFTLSMPLKTSSVNVVQKRINLLEPDRPSSVMNALVHIPTHEYTGKNGSSRIVQNRNNPDMNARVRPVGARKAIGCPQRIEYSFSGRLR